MSDIHAQVKTLVEQFDSGRIFTHDLIAELRTLVGIEARSSLRVRPGGRAIADQAARRAAEGMDTPDKDEEEAPAALLARQIQDRRDPVVIGYTIGVNTLTLRLKPQRFDDWQRWIDEVHAPVGSTTSRGSLATASGSIGPVTICLVGYDVPALLHQRMQAGA